MAMDGNDGDEDDDPIVPTDFTQRVSSSAQKFSRERGSRALLRRSAETVMLLAEVDVAASYSWSCCCSSSSSSSSSSSGACAPMVVDGEASSDRTDDAAAPPAALDDGLPGTSTPYLNRRWPTSWARSLSSRSRMAASPADVALEDAGAAAPAGVADRWVAALQVGVDAVAAVLRELPDLLHPSPDLLVVLVTGWLRLGQHRSCSFSEADVGDGRALDNKKVEHEKLSFVEGKLAFIIRISQEH
uniref:Uncharacterized protein n=1 Tax=Oryza glumipatula TaxID=40148 RepID=A0A0E0BLN5_9ORYZ